MAETTIEWTARALDEYDGNWETCPGCGRELLYVDGVPLHPGFTFNPWWGCEKISPACKNCYAEVWDKRVGGDHWGTNARRFFGDKHWAKPLAWNRHAQELGIRLGVFCMSMGDVFENRHGLGDVRERLFALIEDTPWLEWMLLTKRAENAQWMIPMRWLESPPDVMLGVTVEDQARADQLLPILRDIAWSDKKFISYEPALERVDFQLDGIDLLIAGGESGGKTKRRPMSEDWVRHARDQADVTGTSFFYKQRIDDSGTKIKLPMLDGQQHAALPEELR